MAQAASQVTRLHDAVRAGDLAAMRALLEATRRRRARNKHGLTPLGCAVEGSKGHWQRFTKASTEDWRKITEMLRARGGVE